MPYREILKKFIVLEGLDGSGTTTQLNMLGEKFRQSNINCLLTMEPTGGCVGEIIRKALKKEIVLDKKTLALLFSADRNEHLCGRDSIREHLARGDWIVSDRYFFSSIAYQSLDCEREWVISLNNYPLPEYLFFLDISPEECQERVKRRNSKEIFDDIAMQKKILENYRYAFSLYEKTQMKIHYIDGTLSPDIINEKIWNIINNADK